MRIRTGEIGIVFRGLILSATLGLLLCAFAAADATEDAENEANVLAVSILWDLSDQYFHAGEYQQSIDVNLMVAILDPSDTDSYSNSAWLYDSTERGDKAYEMLLLGAERNPSSFEPYYDLGMWHFDHKQYDKAAEQFDRARRLPCPIYVWHMLAHAYEKQGKLTESIAAWERALRCDPNDAPAKTNLERVKKALADTTPASD